MSSGFTGSLWSNSRKTPISRPLASWTRLSWLPSGGLGAGSCSSGGGNNNWDATMAQTAKGASAASVRKVMVTREGSVIGHQQGERWRWER